MTTEAPIIPTLPPAPVRGESGSDFVEKSNNHVAALGPWTTAINQFGAWVSSVVAEIRVLFDQTSTAQSAAAVHASNAYASSNLANSAAAAAQAAAGLPPTAQFGQVLHTEGQSRIISTAQLLVTGTAYEVDTSAGAFSVPLPPNPNVGDFVWLNDHAGKFAKNNLTVLRNGQKILGKSEDYIMDLNYLNNVLIYISASHGWAIK